MAKTKQEIINEIGSHINEEGSGYRSWYVGIASDPRARLFNDHNVTREKSWWIFCEATSSENARAVEQHFLDLGCDGGSGGGDTQTKSVYAYRKTQHTNP